MLARNVRNVIYNYTDAQRKVRSATSNDAWGPSPALMHEIADLTDNAVAYAEIMPIVWKRLNDHGKNWRHVYKSLVLLDHLIKYGNERVSQQCKENIFAIQTLKDFQYVEDQKDQGFNVREKAKHLVAFLKDDERLRNERRKAQEARERYNRQAMGMDSHGAVTYGHPITTTTMRRNSLEGTDPYGGASHLSSHAAGAFRSTSYNENLHAGAVKGFVLPSNQEEEQLQMQIAMAESQREAEDEERRRRNDDLKLKMALERSVSDSAQDPANPQLFDFNSNNQRLTSSIFDANPNNDRYPSVTTTSNTTWNATPNRPPPHIGFSPVANDPWDVESNDRNSASSTSNRTWSGAPSASGWQPVSASHADSWNAAEPAAKHDSNGLSINIVDPWGVGSTGTQISSPPAASSTIGNELSDFFGAGAATLPTPVDQHASSNPWNVPSTTTSNNYFPSPAMNIGSISPPTTMGAGNLLYPTIAAGGNQSDPRSASPSSLSASRKTPESFLGDKFSTLVDLDKLVTDPKNTNPFGSTAVRTPNPFASATKPPTLDQLTSSNAAPFTSGSTLPPPLIPSSFNGNSTNALSLNTNNPFM